MTVNNEAVEVRARQEARNASLASVAPAYTLEQINVIKNTVAAGATDAELGLFLTVAQRTGLDVFTKQIHFVKRWDSQKKCEVGAHQVGIDGFRVIAQRQGTYRGRVGPWWCGKDGLWRDLWTDDAASPFAAKVGVLVAGYAEPIYATARWGAYAQKKKDGDLTKFWRDMGPEQLAKCAEALALRIAFPNDLSGLHTDDELPFVDDAPAAVRPAAAAVKRDASVKARASASVAEVLNESGDAATDAAGKDATPDMEIRPDEMSPGDRLDMFVQCSPDEVILSLAALRQATKGERKFYELHDDASGTGAKRCSIVDAELLTAFRKDPVNTWLDQIAKNAGAWRLFCGAVLKVAETLNVEVIR